ncbi:Ricin [Daldinia childiae]|uniref:Ricin n=1 Tax=Daldinia childiae TaxID=326645 RepID=UPI001445ACD9|nr:Ricin [Daldinia childiae]KAF3058554.1 Ricin [Daldinia childiae]
MGDTTLTFDVAGHGGEYQNFISALRSALGSGKFIRNLPVLPRQHKLSWTDVLLRADSLSLRLRVRSNSLYLDGFQKELPCSPWFEFGVKGDQHLLPESEFLGFSGDYISLELAAKTKRLDLPLGQTPLAGAVRQLATVEDPSTPENKVATATSLLVVIQMISESVRFQYISSYLVDNWASSLKPSPYVIGLEAAWGTLSQSLIHAEQDPDPEHFRLPDNDLGLKDADGVSEGRALVEVFSVRIENNHGPMPLIGKLYGDVTAIDALGSQDIYHQDRIGATPVVVNSSLLLTGPKRSILANDSFVLDLDLWDTGSDSSPDINILHGQIPWNLYDLTNKYHEVITQQIDGQAFKANVRYIVLSNAVQALVEVTVNKGDGDDPVNIYGNITAHTEYGNVVLFDKDENHYVDVRLGNDIPLSRSTAAVLLSEKIPLFSINSSLFDVGTPTPPTERLREGAASSLPKVHLRFKQPLSLDNTVELP